MTDCQQFFDRIDNGNVMSARFHYTGHNGDRHFFTTADQRSVDAVRALSQQADTMQNMFNLGKFLIDERFQLRQRKSRLGGGESRQKFGKNTFGIADIGQSILAANRFFNHRHQMVGYFGGSREDCSHLPLPGIALQNIGNPQKTFRICH